MKCIEYQVLVGERHDNAVELLVALECDSKLTASVLIIQKLTTSSFRLSALPFKAFFDHANT